MLSFDAYIYTIKLTCSTENCGFLSWILPQPQFRQGALEDSADACGRISCPLLVHQLLLSVPCFSGSQLALVECSRKLKYTKCGRVHSNKIIPSEFVFDNYWFLSSQKRGNPMRFTSRQNSSQFVSISFTFCSNFLRSFCFLILSEKVGESSLSNIINCFRRFSFCLRSSPVSAQSWHLREKVLIERYMRKFEIVRYISRYMRMFEIVRYISRWKKTC